MKGQELIDWIKEHHAEEMKVVVLYRDSGGVYLGCDEELVLGVDNSGGEKVVVL